jgi:hypothetical protein
MKIIMRKNILYIVLISVLLFACKKNDKLVYSTKDNIYLNYKNADGNLDSSQITYSFAYHPEFSKDTLWVPVIISGERVNHDRKFVLTVVDEKTTAVRDKHYEPFKAFYIMPADSGTIHIPIVIKNTDTALVSNSVSLTFRVEGGDDFDSALPIENRSKSVYFSNRLEKPEWWIYWQSSLGDYSRFKHQLFLISSGTVDLVSFTKPNFYLEIPRALFYIDNTRTFTRDPAAWIAKHPEKGFVLTKRTDGSEDYDFYNSASPEKKFYLKYYPQLSTYFFVDEYGKQIII